LVMRATPSVARRTLRSPPCSQSSKIPNHPH